jgi:hypothetical protein
MSIDTTARDRSKLSPEEREEAVRELIEMLHHWSEGDEDDAREQAETFAKVAKGIDQARTPYRTLFDGDRP